MPQVHRQHVHHDREIAVGRAQGERWRLVTGVTRPWPAVVARIVLAAMLIPLGQPTRAQWDPVLSDVAITEAPGCTTIRIGFEIPVIYLRHFQYESGETLLVMIRPVGGNPRSLESELPRETASIPPSGFTALRDIVFEGDAPGGPYLSILFMHELSYEVRQGRDYRSIVVHVRSPGASEPCPPER